MVQVSERAHLPPPAPRRPQPLAPLSVRERQERRQRSNRRVRVPISGAVRDPLARPEGSKGRRLGRFTILLVGGALLHVLILAGFLGASALGRYLEPPPEAPPPEDTEVAVLEEPAEEAQEEPPEEPELQPLEAPEPSWTPPVANEAPAPPIGISADSTVEGGSGPSFRTGLSLAGAMADSGLAQEILGRENKKTEAAAEMVMTADTVDSPAKALPNNRAPTPPGKARQNGISGYVVLSLLVGKDGSVLESRIARSDPPGFFDEKVLEVVPSWRFTPATYKGQPVVMRVDQKIRFDIK